ncbi:hypothetical protein Bca52824_016431 [Brassica carinata]|uniref:Uncharacterized protein n=1 Tax=Brassica carinata TaxID=52824 RepID=A0A8X7W711_BRACI|nr:hypothetical protein Bca52824_016431 [Brassica carinata]
MKRRAKKIEDILTSIESKGNEDVDRQWNDFDYGRDQGKDKEMAEAGKKNSEMDEEDSLTNICEKARVQAEHFWRKLDDESDDEKEAKKEAEKREKTPTPPEKGAEKKPEETPTPLRGRTKTAAARRQSHTLPDNWITPPAVEAPEKKTGICHRPKVMAVKGGSTRAERLAKKAQGITKKRGRPKKTAATLKPCTPLPEKRKSEPSRWVQSPFTEGKTDELEVPKKKPTTKA